MKLMMILILLDLDEFEPCNNCSLKGLSGTCRQREGSPHARIYTLATCAAYSMVSFATEVCVWTLIPL